MGIRRTDFAGSWYPGSAAGCEKEIRGFLKDSGSEGVPPGPFLGGIVPHAGWYFSGRIACNVIHRLGQHADTDVVIVFGMHLPPRAMPHITTSGAWETPFGDIEIDAGIAEELAGRFRFKVETAEVFTPDNTIELQLPFVKYFFKDARLVPIGVPMSEQAIAIGEAAAEIAARQGVRVKIIGSTDLTHYGPNYGFESHGYGKPAVDWVRNENDRRMIDTILALDAEGVIRESLSRQNACCAGAVAAAIAAAKKLGATRAEKVEYATSYDKSPGDSFVGYVGVGMK